LVTISEKKVCHQNQTGGKCRLESNKQTVNNS